MSCLFQIAVIGFDHAQGNRIEFLHPPIDNENYLKHLPFIALPDGVHNQNEDFVFFSLPLIASTNDLVQQKESTNDNETTISYNTIRKSVDCLFGVAFFVQIDAKLLKGLIMNNLFVFVFFSLTITIF